MSASLPADVRLVVDRDDHVKQPVSMPALATGVTHRLLPVGDSSTAVQFAGGPPPPPLLLHHVPSSSAAAVDVVADAFSSSSNGSSTFGGAGYGGPGVSAGVPLPTRRTREFIPESKKDDEYWSKRQKNNEAAKRSREKRRANDTVMMRRIHELAAENKRLKMELDVLRRQLGLAATSANSLPPPPVVAASSALDSVAQLPATDDHATSRQTLEPPPSTVCYDDAGHNAVSTSSYRSSGAVAMVQPIRGEENQRPEETHLYRHPVYRAEWPTTCGVGVSLSASPVDARTLAGLPTYRHSISGNLLPSIGDLCGRAARQNSSAGGPSSWTSYRSRTDGDRPSAGREPALPRAGAVDSAPIVIFSDVSSSEDDSVDDSFYGRHADTVTLRQSVEPVRVPGVLESPLNLSTPSRHQSPATVPTRRADSGGVTRRSSVDVLPVTAPWLPIRESELSTDPAAVGRCGDGVLLSRRASYVDDPRRRAPLADEWPQEAKNGSMEVAQRDLSSRSTSLSSVASVAWTAGVDTAPHQPADDDVPVPVRAVLAGDRLPAGGQLVRCGLPLKVRRKLGSASTCHRMVVEDAPRPPCAAELGQSTSRMLSEDRDGSASLSPEWFRSTTVERDRLARMSDLDVLDQRDDR